MEEEKKDIVAQEIAPVDTEEKTKKDGENDGILLACT